MSSETLAVPGALSPPDPRRWIALAVIVGAQFMVVLDVAIVNVALPSIKTDLHFTQESLQWVVTAYAILFGGALLLGGRIADLLGRRRLFMAGLVVFTASSLLDGLAWSEGSLIAFRALQGLGAALLSPAALSILTTTFREGRERNLALGIWGAASGSGGAAGVLLGGALTSALSWSWIFYINVPVGALVLAVTPWLLRESRAELDHRHFDLPGAASITAGLMLLVYAMTRATQHGWGTTETIGLLAASAALIAAFVAIELRSKAPLLPMRIFRLRTLSGANVAGLLLGGAVFSQFFLLTGVGLALAFVPMTIGALTGVRQSDAGIASGLINTSQQIGGAIGVAAATTIATTVTGHYVHAHAGTTALSGAALAHGFEIAFYALAAVAALAAIVAAVLIESRRAAPEVELIDTDAVALDA